MQISIYHHGRKYRTDLSRGIDLSSSLGKPGGELKAWGVPGVLKEPVKAEGWTGSVAKGSSVNFYNIHFNPHGNGTHTESYGHIDRGQKSVNKLLPGSHLIARLVELKPENRGGDQVISAKSLQGKVKKWNMEALIVKTGDYGAGHDFSGTNPPYFEPELLRFIREMGILHFLTDLPSVDKEEDGGKLLSHKAFWDYPENPRQAATISELLLIPDDVKEGLYLLNLQIAPFENDASPSRPVIFPLEELG